MQVSELEEQLEDTREEVRFVFLRAAHPGSGYGAMWSLPWPD